MSGKKYFDKAGVLKHLTEPSSQVKEETTLTASKPVSNIEEMGVAEAPVNIAMEDPSMEAPNINNVLSVELLDTILGLLSPPDLKSAVLVCKYWNAIGEKPHLWTWVELRVTKENLVNMPKILDLSRLAKVEMITLEHMSMKVLLAIEKHQGLELLFVDECEEPFVNSNILARVITRIEEVHFRFARLKTEQWNAIFKSLSNGAKLKKLIIIGMSFYQQCSEIKYAKGASNLKVLDIGDNDLCLVETDKIAKTVSKIYGPHILPGHDYDLKYMSRQEVKTIFKQLNKDGKLKTLNMRIVDLSPVKGFPGTAVSKIEANLEEADLCYADLTTQQLEAIFVAIESRRELKVINL